LEVEADMILIDNERCTYCGGCVSICPVEALTLNDTNLVVDPVCIDCGDCASACPVGALNLEFGHGFESKLQLKSSYDLVVIGAGPGGSTAAHVAAQAGLSVLLLEKRQEIGSPVRCAEGVGHDQLLPFIEPDPRWIASEIKLAEINVLDNHHTRTLRAEGGRGYILERRIFDRILAERAVQAGAEVRVKTAATGLLFENGQVCGVRIHHSDFIAGPGEMEITAKVVIAADGVESQVGRWAGLDTQMLLKDSMVCVQYLLAGIQIDPNCTSYTIGYQTAPGGYAWVFPKGEGKANVGLGVQADLWEKISSALPPQPGSIGERTVLGFLTRFIESNPGLEQGSPVTLVAGNVPVALSHGCMVTGGLMLVGDAARQVDPLTGGGIINAMTAGQLAAQTAILAIEASEPSADFLSSYPQEWERTIGRKLQRNYRLREKFSPVQRTDERFVRAFALAAGG